MLFDWILSSNQTHEDHNDCHYQEDMDKSAQSVRSNKSEEPEDEQYDCYSGKHVESY